MKKIFYISAFVLSFALFGNVLASDINVLNTAHYTCPNIRTFNFTKGAVYVRGQDVFVNNEKWVVKNKKFVVKNINEKWIEHGVKTGMSVQHSKLLICSYHFPGNKNFRISFYPENANTCIKYNKEFVCSLNGGRN